ncbi:Ctf8-domain-containing protein [Radiomyces spectabilis]|uniref:Ctf8-domain-containing protein n=1 Tax=Radiomyces spectabilis TaxID=64574 RepID=UPI00221F59E4|nr:Ctf8-domain-containing protein [Radiomyces spectabilis]KAI8381323.1 Ctf8-domain-containing protein [Radiomyces spectabilis]
MVHTVIRPLSRSENKQELVYLDFQGSFVADDHANVSDAYIGDLTLEKDKAILSIGHHRLEGKKVKLPKPFAVIQKSEQDLMETDTSPGAYYDVVTILREKYVFNTRPGLVVEESMRGFTKIGG